jgi:hypothetical protein
MRVARPREGKDRDLRNQERPGAFQSNSSTMTPFGSRTWKARSPQSSAAHGAAYSPAHAYEFGLQVILDGFGALIGGRGRPAL